MSVARQLQNRNRLQESASHARSNSAPRLTEAASHPIDIQRFPSSTISNETFMHIDDSWPRENESTAKRPGRFFSIFIRWKIWIYEHKIISVVVAIVVLLILLVGIAAVIVVVVIKKSSNGSSNNSTSSIPLTTSASTLSTTFEPYAEGTFGGSAIRCYALNFSVLQASLRPDRRQNESFILTTRGTISLFKTFATPFLSQMLWAKEDIAGCSSVDLTLPFSPYSRLWEHCDVLDVTDNCRRDATLCNDSSLVYCCENCTSSVFMCSVYGTKFENRGSTFLDAVFQFSSAQEQILKFSFFVIDGNAGPCLLGTREVLITNGVITSVEFPAKVFSFGQFGFHANNLLSIVVERNDGETWGSMLTKNGTLYVSNFEDILHKVDDLVNDSESRLHSGSVGGSIFIGDITAGKFSFVKVNQSAIAVSNPKIENFDFPGTFVDAFIDNGNIIEYHISNNVLFIAQVKFCWNI